MPDRVVVWRAVANFSSVVKESAKAEAALASLQAEVDEINASNNRLGASEAKLASETKKANNQISSSIGSVSQARGRAEQASNSLSRAQSAEAASSIQVKQAALQAAAAKQKEKLATDNVQRAISKLSEAHKAEEAAQRAEASSRYELAKAYQDQKTSAEDLAKAEQKIVNAERATAAAAENSKKASENLQRQQLKEASARTASQLAALRATTTQIRAEQELGKQLERNDALRRSVTRSSAIQQARQNAPQVGPTQSISSAVDRQQLAALKQRIALIQNVRRFTDEEAKSVGSLISKEDSLNTAYSNLNKTADTLSRRLGELEAAKARSVSASQELISAERNLSDVRQKFGDNSVQSVIAERQVLQSRLGSINADEAVAKAERDVATSRSRLSVLTATAAAAEDKFAQSMARADRQLVSSGSGGNGFTNILDGLANAFGDASGGAEKLGSALSLLKIPAIIGGIYELISALSALVTGLFEVASAAAPALETLAAIGPSLFAAGTVVGTVGTAFRGVISTLRQYSLAQKSARAATDGVTSAANSAKDAQIALAQAQQNVKDTARQGAESVASAAHSIVEANRQQLQSEEALNQARKDAIQNIQQLKNAVVDAALAEKGATLDLASAKENLQQVLNDPNSTRLQREQAQLQVQSAAQQLVESKQSNQQTQQQERLAVKQGVSGSPAVKQAAQSLSDANYSKKQAQQKYIDAVTQAEENNKRAVQDLAKAEDNLAKAQKTAAAGSSSASTSLANYKAELAALSPAAQKFVKTLISMRGTWNNIKKSSSSGLFPGLTKALKNLSTLAPFVDSLFNKMGKTLGGLAVKFSQLFTAPDGSAGLKILGQASTVIVKNLGNAFINLADAMGAVSQAAVPMTEDLTKGFEKWTKKLSVLAETTSQNKMITMFHHAAGVLKELGQITKNIIIGFYNMGKAAGGPGRSMLDSMNSILKKWAEWTGSKKGQAELSSFFNKVRSNLQVIDHYIGRLVGGFLKLGANKSLKPIMQALSNLWTAIKGAFGKGDVGKGVAGIINNIASAITGLTNVGSVLGGFVDVLGGFTGALAWILKHKAVADTIGAIALAFGAFKGVRAIGGALGIGSFARGISTFTKGAAAASPAQGGILRRTASRVGAGLLSTTTSKEGTKAAAESGGLNKLGLFVSNRKIKKSITQAEANQKIQSGDIYPDVNKSGQTIYRDANTGEVVWQPSKSSRVGSALRPIRSSIGGAFGRASGFIGNQSRMLAWNLGFGRGHTTRALGAIGRGIRRAPNSVISRLRRNSTPTIDEAIKASQQGASNASDIVSNLLGQGSGGGQPSTKSGGGILGIFKRARNRITGSQGGNDSGFLRFFGGGGSSSNVPPLGGSKKGLLSRLFGKGGSSGEGGGRFKGLKSGLAGGALAGLAIGGQALGSLIDNGKGGVRSGIAGGLEGASQGAMFGMMFGPEGAIVGAIAGGLWGVFTKTKLGGIIAKWWKKDAWPAIKKLPKEIGGFFANLGRWISDPFKKAFDAIEPIVKPIWDALWAVLSVAFKIWVGVTKIEFKIFSAILTTGFKLIKDMVVPVWKIMWALLSGAWRVFWTLIKTEFNVFKLFVTTIFNVVKDVVTGKWGKIWDDLRGAWDKFWGYLKTAFNTVASVVGKVFGTIGSTIAGAFGGAFDKVKSILIGAINFITQDILNKFITAINAVTHLFGIPKIPYIPAIGQSSGGGAAQTGASGTGRSRAYAKGGVTPGYTPGRDVHKFVSPTGGELHLSGGEGILVPEATRALGGRRGIERINRTYSSRLPSAGNKFAGGGVFAGNHDQQQGYGRWLAWRALTDMMQGSGGVLGGIGSALKNVVSLARHGLAGVATAGLQAAETPLRLLTSKIPVPFLGKLMNGIFDKVNSGIANLIRGKQSKGKTLTNDLRYNGVISGQTDRNNVMASAFMLNNAKNMPNKINGGSAYAKAVLLSQGALAQALNTIISNESGWNTRAINLTDSNAKAGHPSQGLAQTIPSTYNAYKNPNMDRGILDAISNVTAGVNYANHNYGDLNNVPGVVGVRNGTGYVGYAKGGIVQRFAKGGVVGALSSGAANKALAAMYIQGGLGWTNGVANWSAGLTNLYKSRLSGVSATKDVIHTSSPPTAEGLLQPNSRALSGFEYWLDYNANSPTSYDQIWKNQPYPDGTWNNTYNRNPMFPILAYLSDPGGFQGWRKNRNLSYMESMTKKKGTAALSAYKKMHPKSYSNLLDKENVWNKYVGIIKSAYNTDKQDVSALRSALGLSAATGNGLYSSDMVGPADTAMANALGITHPADWTHPWDGPVSSVESGIADQQRANALNQEWNDDLTILADWGLTYLVDSLLSQGISSGLETARSAVRDRTNAAKLDQAIKAGQEIGGGNTDNQANILHVVARVASGSPTHPYGLRDISSYLNVPDYAVVDLWDQGLSAALSKIASPLTSKLTNDVSLFRQGLFYANSGAIVPGSGNKDTVPAMLTPGEGVLNTMAMRMLGVNKFNKLNSGIPIQAFANGGIVLAPTVSNSVLGSSGVDLAAARSLAKRGNVGDSSPTVIEMNTNIYNPTGENSVLSMTKNLRRQASLGVVQKAAGQK